jgi:hypothetical protein
MLQHGEFEKAAEWALFHNDTTSCIKALAASGDPQNKIIATALAGFPGRSSSASYSISPGSMGSSVSSSGSTTVSALQMALWKDLSHTITSPYLRAAFLFASSSGNFHSVLGVQELSLCNRVGVALRFLPDDEVT